MPHGAASKAPSPFHTVCSLTHIRRGLKSLEEVVWKELGAPYTCQLIPETGQIVLTPEKESTSPGLATSPTMWDKTVCARPLMTTGAMAGEDTGAVSTARSNCFSTIGARGLGAWSQLGLAAWGLGWGPGVVALPLAPPTGAC